MLIPHLYCNPCCNICCPDMCGNCDDIQTNRSSDSDDFSPRFFGL